MGHLGSGTKRSRALIIWGGQARGARPLLLPGRCAHVSQRNLPRPDPRSRVRTRSAAGRSPTDASPGRYGRGATIRMAGGPPRHQSHSTLIISTVGISRTSPLSSGFARPCANHCSTADEATNDLAHVVNGVVAVDVPGPPGAHRPPPSLVLWHSRRVEAANHTTSSPIVHPFRTATASPPASGLCATCWYASICQGESATVCQ